MIIKDYKNINEIVLWAYGKCGSEINYETIGFKKNGKPSVVSVENNDYMRQYMKYYIHSKKFQRVFKKQEKKNM